MISSNWSRVRYRNSGESVRVEVESAMVLEFDEVEGNLLSLFPVQPEGHQTTGCLVTVGHREPTLLTVIDADGDPARG